MNAPVCALNQKRQASPTLCDGSKKNRPRFNRNCRDGARCVAANCYYTHPPDRVEVERLDQYCRLGRYCTNRYCKLKHPQEKETLQFIPSTPKRPCRNGTFCSITGCTFDHKKKQKRCLFGRDCRNKFTCLYDH